MLDVPALKRYSRQILLKEIGPAGQKKILQAKVLVIGAGGLGSPALYYLAAAGVGTIGIVDFDEVDISNLQRQILHFTDDLGKHKTDSAEAKLQRLNPQLQVIKYPFAINSENISELIQGYDVVLDATDNFPTRFLISDHCYKLQKPLVESAVLGWEGLMMTIIPGRSPCYRCLYPEPPSEDVPTSQDVGILGMVAGVMGSLQALEAVKLILNSGSLLMGRILTFDGLNLTFREIAWTQKVDCPLCGQRFPA